MNSLQDQEITIDVIELISELFRTSLRNKEVIALCCNALKRIGISDFSSLQVAEKALIKYCEFITPCEYDPEKKQILSDCVQMIQKNLHVIPSLTIINKILCQYATFSSSATSIVTKSDIITFLENTHQFLDLFFKVI